MAANGICQRDGCSNPKRTKGLCNHHYSATLYRAPCSVEGCDGRQHGRTYCLKHLKRWYRHGDPEGGKDYKSARAFLAAALATKDPSACVIWPYSRNRGGYGQIRLDGRSRLVSRVVCTTVHGDPPSAKHHAAHNCGKGHMGCINPHHLEWKLPVENNRDKIRHGTHLSGHRSPRSKLTKEAVDFIRANKKTRKLTNIELAKKYGVTPGAISCAGRGKTHKR